MTIRPRLRNAAPFLSEWGLLLFLVLMALFRAVLLDDRLRPLAACKGCMALLTVQHDAAVLGVVLGAFVLAHLTKRHVLRRALRISICLVVLIYGLDLLVIGLYNMRLVGEDFFKYGREVGGVITIARRVIETWQGVAMALVLIALGGLMVGFVRSSGRPGRKAVGAVLASGMVLFAVGMIPSRRVFAHDWAYRNVFAINLDRAILASYTDEFGSALLESQEDLRRGDVCTSRPPARPNVVMVVLESFSMYQSRFFSGLRDFTPNLDRIAASHTAFTRFWANGFTTENGLIALLAGQVPTPGPDQIVFGGGFAFDGFSDLPHSLPRVFGSHRYHTAFLTAGDLAFSGKGAWLDALGFDELIGHDDPFFDGWPRLHFHAAPDSALYLRALDWVDARQPDQPFFLVIETVSSHHPFIEPGTRKKSEEAVFRYADRQLGLFYDALVARGVLDSVLLVVASDHRAMTPVSAEEFDRFGDEARALVPFVIADPVHPGARRVEDRYQQVDLASSIEGRLTGRSCPTMVRGDLLGDETTPPQCVMHTRGEDRGRVDIVCGDAQAAIRLRGDRTAVESGSLPDPKLLVDQLNLERLERRAVRGRRGG